MDGLPCLLLCGSDRSSDLSEGVAWCTAAPRNSSTHPNLWALLLQFGDEMFVQRRRVWRHEYQRKSPSGGDSAFLVQGERLSFVAGTNLKAESYRRSFLRRPLYSRPRAGAATICPIAFYVTRPASTSNSSCLDRRVKSSRFWRNLIIDPVRHASPRLRKAVS